MYKQVQAAIGKRIKKKARRAQNSTEEAEARENAEAFRELQRRGWRKKLKGKYEHEPDSLGDLENFFGHGAPAPDKKEEEEAIKEAIQRARNEAGF